MIQYLLATLSLALGTTPLENGVLRAIAAQRVSCIHELLVELSSSNQGLISKLEIKQSVSDRLSCDRYPRIQLADSSEFATLLSEVVAPETSLLWDTFTEEKHALFCGVLQQSIETTKIKLDTRRESEIRLRLLANTYIELARKFDSLDPVPVSALVIDVLSTAEAYERYQRVRKRLRAIIRDFSNTPPGGVGDLAWPMGDSESLLCDLVQGIVAEGSGEEKVGLFLRKMFESGQAGRQSICIMARRVVTECTADIKLLGDRLLNFEKELVLETESL
jgi:hypothetical protein